MSDADHLEEATSLESCSHSRASRLDFWFEKQMKTTCLALCLIAACGSVLAEDEKAEGKPSGKVIAKVDRTKEFADVVTDPPIRQFAAASTNCYNSSAEDIAASRTVFKDAFSPGSLKCDIVFEKGASIRESQLCPTDILVYSGVIEGVKDDGTFAYSLRIERAYAGTRGRPNPKIKAIVCHSKKSAIKDVDTKADFAGWNTVPSEEVYRIITSGSR